CERNAQAGSSTRERTVRRPPREPEGPSVPRTSGPSSSRRCWTMRRMREPRVPNGPMSSRGRREPLPRYSSSVDLRMLVVCGSRLVQLVVDEVRVAGRVEQFTCDHRLAPTVAAQRDNLIEQIARLTGAQGPIVWGEIAPVEVSHHDLMEAQAPPGAVQFEDARELLDGWILDRDFVRNPSEKRFVAERRRIEVGREDGEHIERHLDFFPGVQRQIVHAAFER